MLNLITCTGTFDHKRRTHIDRLVVSAELTNDSGQEHLQKPVAPTHLEKSGQTLSWHSTPEAAVVGYNVYAIDTKTGTKKANRQSRFSREKKRYDQIKITRKIWCYRSQLRFRGIGAGFGTIKKSCPSGQLFL